MTAATLAFVIALLLGALPSMARAAAAVPTAQDPVARRGPCGFRSSCAAWCARTRPSPNPARTSALDLRQQMREQIAAGRSDDEIIAYMVARYGDFVLYRPPLKATTVLLWAGPALLLIGGLVILARVSRSRRRLAEDPPLSAEDRERAARLLAPAPAKETR